MMWKIFAVVLGVLNFFGVLDFVAHASSHTAVEWAVLLPMAVIGTAGVVGYAFRVSLFHPKYWNATLIIYGAATLVQYAMWVNRSLHIHATLPPLAVPIVIGVIFIITVPPAYALYKNTLRSDPRSAF